MPAQKTGERTQRDKKEGTSPATRAREFVRQEFQRQGKRGAIALQQAIPVGLRKAGRAAVDLHAPEAGGGGRAEKQLHRGSEKGGDKTPGSEAAATKRKSSKRRLDARSSAG